MEPIPENKESNVTMNINENNGNNLTNEDLQSMINILNICCQRGSFRIEELKNIGLFYERLNNLKKNVDTT